MVQTYHRVSSNDFCQVGIKLNLESNLNQNASVKEIQQIIHTIFHCMLSFLTKPICLFFIKMEAN